MPLPTDFTAGELDYLVEHLHEYTPTEQRQIQQLIDERYDNHLREQCKTDLIAFCCYMQPDYKVGSHHRHLAKLLMAIAKGEKDRVCVNIPPRHGKSLLVSTYFPAWFIGSNPGKKILMVSHTTDLAVDFSRTVRNIVDSEEYQFVFPGVKLAKDSKSAGRWDTTTGTTYFACGVGSKLAGRGADLLLCDDPHSEQDLLNGNAFNTFEKAYQWFTYGARTRLMPQGRVAIIQTRWHAADLTGRMIQDMANNPDADQYEVVEFPAILDVEQEDGTVVEKALWPEFYDLAALRRTKASMPPFQWNAQYQQNPTAEEASIIKREWWNEWTGDNPPKCEYVIMTLDAAAETNNRADFTALTTWGVFFNEEHEGPGANSYNLILLNAIKERLEFPELKELALQEYQEWEPDSFIVEKKSNGVPLYQELRRMGLPISEFTPHRGSGDKMARLNAVSDIVRSGLCWIPPTRWAEELVEEVASFPFAKNDDQTDSTVIALTRFRQGGFIRLPSDEKDEPVYFKSQRKRYY